METVPAYPSTKTEAESRDLFAHLQAGDRIEATHEVKVGQQRWQEGIQVLQLWRL